MVPSLLGSLGSSDVVRRGRARPGEARLGLARLGEASTLRDPCVPSLLDPLIQRLVRPGRVRFGKAWLGLVRLGMAT